MRIHIGHYLANMVERSMLRKDVGYHCSYDWQLVCQLGRVVMVQRIERCKEVIAQDDAARSQLGLSMPTMKDYKLRLNSKLKDMSAYVYHGILRRHGIMDYTPPMNPKRIRQIAKKREKRAAKRARGQLSASIRAGFAGVQSFPGNRGGYGRGVRGVGRLCLSSGNYWFRLLHFLFIYTMTVILKNLEKSGISLSIVYKS